jgi:uncharacterized SAM-binding protein YcdF (DUF218 family)
MKPGPLLLALATLLVTTVEVGVVQLTWPIEYGRDDVLPPKADAIVVFYGEDSRRDRAVELATAGVAPIVVMSLGNKYRPVNFTCGQTRPFVVWCPTPARENTESEMRMFASMIEQHSWGNVIAVTNTYHKQRAKLLVNSCIESEVSFATTTNEWRRRIRIVRDELFKFVYLKTHPVTCETTMDVHQ